MFSAWWTVLWKLLLNEWFWACEYRLIFTFANYINRAIHMYVRCIRNIVPLKSR